MGRAYLPGPRGPSSPGGRTGGQAGAGVVRARGPARPAPSVLPDSLFSSLELDQLLHIKEAESREAARSGSVWGLRCALLGLPAGLVVQTWALQGRAEVRSLARELLSHKPGAGVVASSRRGSRGCACVCGPQSCLWSLLPGRTPPLPPTCPRLLLHWDICPNQGISIDRWLPPMFNFS